MVIRIIHGFATYGVLWSRGYCTPTEYRILIAQNKPSTDYQLGCIACSRYGPLPQIHRVSINSLRIICDGAPTIFLFKYLHSQLHQSLSTEYFALVLRSILDNDEGSWGYANPNPKHTALRHNPPRPLLAQIHSSLIEKESILNISFSHRL